MIRQRVRTFVRFGSAVLLVMILSGITTRMVEADILYRTGNSPPMVGKILREEKLEVVFLEQFLSGAENERKVFRADVLRLIRTIDDQRLGKLSPENPQDYFDYAEELAAFEKDFVARRLAMRLYLIAAFHSRGELRKSSFLGLLSFGFDRPDENRIRALAVLSLEPRDRKEFLPANEEPTIDDTAGRKALLVAVRQLRRGQMSEANKGLQKPEVRQAAHQSSQIIDWSELYRLSLSKDLKLESMLLLIRLESYLIGDSNTEKIVPIGSGWELQSTRKMKTSQDWIRFDNVTPFDPARSLYRNGQWQQPSGTNGGGG